MICGQIGEHLQEKSHCIRSATRGKSEEKRVFQPSRGLNEEGFRKQHKPYVPDTTTWGEDRRAARPSPCPNPHDWLTAHEESNAANAAVMLNALRGRLSAREDSNKLQATSQSAQTQNEFAFYTRKSGGLWTVERSSERQSLLRRARPQHWAAAGGRDEQAGQGGRPGRRCERNQGLSTAPSQQAAVITITDA